MPIYINIYIIESANSRYVSIAAHLLFLEENIMRIILDTDKKTITVPWNYAQKIAEINEIISAGGGNKQYTFSSFLKENWDFCMENTDKHLIVADKPVKKTK